MKEQLFFTGDEFFPALVRDISTAEHTIEFEAYIFANDSLGKEVLTALTAAATRGVRVRVLVDGAGSYEWNHFMVYQLEQAGGESRVFHPFPWKLWQISRSIVRPPSLTKAIYLLLRINRRNHRKICLIDQKIVYLGSFNISKNHVTQHGTSLGWRDTGVRLSTVNTDELVDAFEKVWSGKPLNVKFTTYFKEVQLDPLFRLNNQRHRRKVLYKNLLQRFQKSRQRIWITNAYFVPDIFLLRKLIKAARRGVDVRILLPHQADIAFMPWASKMFYERLLSAGVRIFEYLPTMLHAKTLIIDSWMTIGSSNLNHRSLLHDLEVDYCVQGDEAKFELLQQFLIDLTYAREIKFCDLKVRPWYQRIIGTLLLYLRYFI